MAQAKKKGKIETRRITPVQFRIITEEEKKVVEMFDEARKFVPQGRKDALVRAMLLYVDEVEKLKKGWTTVHVSTSEDSKKRMEESKKNH